ncbi:FAD-dependent oxidoreductase [Nakamurella sp. A5-74]|uniref:FAD-dependent oxidoreductase n=1 Tax=Nakamurella sp. A5-74 TaxID=3158264 RepID=A0AAU8DPE9_9ACTN
MPHILIVGGSIAAATAAGTLRADGWDGAITILGEEEHPPYSRVPLSKGVIAGLLPVAATELPPLPDDVEVRTGQRAVALHGELRAVELADGSRVPYDGLVISTGASARRLAGAGQQGELVVRTLEDAEAIAARVGDARTAIIVGAGFLGMEVASTLVRLGLDVTVVDRDPPLQRLLGTYLAGVLVAAAVESGLRVLIAPDGVALAGNPVSGVSTREHGELSADLVVSAVGDLPNVEWLRTSGLPVQGGVVIDSRCAVAPDIVAAGDVTVQELVPGVFRRSPHWTSAVNQGRVAARTLLHAESASPTASYFWTEQFGCDVKLVGELPFDGEPRVVDGDVTKRSALLHWPRDDDFGAAASLNYRLPIVKLKALAAGAAAPAGGHP